jgi:hypothetical protein
LSTNSQNSFPAQSPDDRRAREAAPALNHGASLPRCDKVHRFPRDCHRHNRSSSQNPPAVESGIASSRETRRFRCNAARDLLPLSGSRNANVATFGCSQTSIGELDEF